MHMHIFMFFFKETWMKKKNMVKKYKQKTFLYIQMVVMTDCESLNIKDNMNLRFVLH